MDMAAWGAWIGTFRRYYQEHPEMTRYMEKVYIGAPNSPLHILFY